MLNYSLVKSDRRTLALQVNQIGQVTVRAPKNTARQRIEEFVRTNLAWVEKAVARAEMKSREYRPVLEYRALFLFGKMLAPRVSDVRGVSVSADGAGILIPKKYFDGCIDGYVLASSEKALTALMRFYAKAALKYSAERLPQYAKELQTDYSAVRISNAGTQWGNCNSRREIRINLRAAFLPPALFDYLLAHELSHTVHLNHSADFWNTVRALDPDCEIHRKKLKELAVLQYIFR